MKDFIGRITSRKFMLAAVAFAFALSQKEITTAAIIAAVYSAVNVYEGN